MASFTARTRNLRALCSLLSLSFVLAGVGVIASPSFAFAEGVPDIIGHIYCNGSTGMQDVTNTIFTSQGQTYAVINGARVAIKINTSLNVVTNVAGTTIGYVAH